MAESSPKGTGASGAGSPAGGPKILSKRTGNVIERVQKTVGKGMDKITFETIGDMVMDKFTTDKKKGKEERAVISAPIGVVHSYSLVLTHVVAPLWAVAAKPVGVVKPINFSASDIVNLAASMDKKGFEFEQHMDALQQDPTMSTAYITLLVSRLLSVEHDEDYYRRGFPEALSTIIKDVKHSGEYEEHYNDETVAHDQPRRKLTEVGGTWRRACANDHGVPGSNLRRKLLGALMMASVSLSYIYTDESLQHMCDSLGSQLFLLSYSESLVSLVAGTKGPQYVAKYLLFLSPPIAEPVAEDCIVADCSVSSLLLQDVTSCVHLAVNNLVHRNDTSDVVVGGMQKAFAVCSGQNQLPSLLTTTLRLLHRVYAADLGVMVTLLDDIRPMVVYPAPVGSLALEVMNAIVEGIRNVNALQRRLCSSVFVAGSEMRSFRRQPAHIITAPYCSRAFAFQKVFLGNVDTQRGANPHWPVVVESGVDPFTNAASQVPIDDVVTFVANHVSNVFQCVNELTNGVDNLQDTANAIQLRELFGIQPYALVPYYPSILQFLSQEKNFLTDPKNTSEEAYAKVAELYLTVVDHNKPVKGSARFRLEAPRPPLYPLTHIVSTEADDMNDVVKHTIDKHWRYCDQRVMEKETAALHPKKELSLSHFIEGYIRLVVAGGGGMLRRVVTAILHMRTMYPGAVPNFRFFILPLGFSNDIASWMARSDPLYKQRVFDPFTSLPQRHVDPPATDAMNGSATPNFESLTLRNRLNEYLLDATVCNELVIYQLEATNPDTSVHYIPFVSNLEFGVHLQQAAQQEEVVHSTHEGVGSISFCADGVSRKDRVNALKASSSPNLVRAAQQQSAGLGANPMIGTQGGGPSNASFAGGSFGTAQAIPSSQDVVEIGDQKESVDRLKIRIHGHRGLPISTKRHPSENADIRNVASGVEILDWISTTYHQYEPGAALKAAQAFMERGILRLEALPTGKDVNKFQEVGLYSVVDREAPDEAPLVIPCPRSKCYESSQGIKSYLDDHSNVSIQQPMKMRIHFNPIQSDLCYKDLSDQTQVRDIVSLKLKSTGSSGDIGSHPDPTTLMLQLSINEVEKRRPARARDKVDQHEHYQLRFGETQRVDPKALLTIESNMPSTTPGQPTGGIMVAVDGDVFGPYVQLKVRPITTSTGPRARGSGATGAGSAGQTSASGSAAAGGANTTGGGNSNKEERQKEPNVATVTVMSFQKPGFF